MSELTSIGAPGALSAAGRCRAPSASSRSRCRAGSGSATSRAARKLALLVVLALIWEAYARWLNNPLLFPTFTATLAAFADAVASGVLPGRALTSLRVLLIGYAAGILCAAVLTTIAISTRIGTDLLELLTSMFNPLPAIALLPLALIWFGLGYGSIVFVIVHSVLWAVALNTHSGFLSVSNTLRMVGRNYGLSRAPLRRRDPDSCGVSQHPHRAQDRLGVRLAHADRRGAGIRRVVGSGGLGWFIYENKNQLEIPNVFAGLLTVILIGLVVENVIFRRVEPGRCVAGACRAMTDSERC